MLLAETIVLPHTVVTVKLDDQGSYHLAYGDLVVYEDGQRRVRGRSSAYAPRSVEQLRYDFERDVESVGGRLG
jgi:hypothetical protein